MESPGRHSTEEGELGKAAIYLSMQNSTTAARQQCSKKKGGPRPLAGWAAQEGVIGDAVYGARIVVYPGCRPQMTKVTERSRAPFNFFHVAQRQNTPTQLQPKQQWRKLFASWPQHVGRFQLQNPRRGRRTLDSTNS